MTDVDKLRAAALVDQALTVESQDDALIANINAFLADAPKGKPHTGYRYGELLKQAADRLEALKTELRATEIEANCEADMTDEWRARAEQASAERDALKLRVNRLVGLCKSYSGALLDSDYPPAERDKLDALVGDIEKP